MKNHLQPTLKILLLFIIVALFTNSVNAQWQTNGPNGADVTCITAGGAGIFAGAGYKSVYLSANNGGSWAVEDSGITGDYVSSLLIIDTGIFTGTLSGLFLSTDSGGTWAKVSTAPIYNVNTFAVSGPNIFAGTSGGVYLSIDNGINWIAKNTGLTNEVIRSFAVSDSGIFAGTEGGVFFSADADGNWTPMNTGLTGYTFVISLAISGDSIFAGTTNGLFISGNNGRSWTAANTGLVNTYIFSIAVSDSGIFAGTEGGVYFSNNNGGNWTSLGLASYYVTSLAISNGYIYASTNTDGVWQQSLAGITTGIQKTSSVVPITFTLYPNPANNNFVVETNTADQQMQVFDITGKLMLTQTIQTGKTSIDASGLADGIYSVRLVSSGGVGNKKLVVVR